MRKLTLVAIALMELSFGLSSGAFAAENSIKQVQVRREGDQLLLKVQMTEKLKAVPGNWSVLEPPRIVFDFPDTDNKTGLSTVPIANGDLKSVNLVQTEKLTRMVLNLTRSNKFSAEIVDDALFVRLSSLSVSAGQEPAPSVYQTAAPKVNQQATGNAITASVRDINFRRGEDGQATITVDLTDGTVPIDVRRSGTGVTVEMRDVELPDRLQNRRDVNDFATPVTTITSRAAGSMTRLDIVARGRWFHQSHLVNNQLIVEVKPIPADEANKLVQSGQQGQKVSINFYAADATMVLRTLADISGKNVMIDPSLTGKTITANLDNIQYDQALEIIMAQVNASMRVKNDVILFGDRAVLLKRDQETADEVTRANDLAPLVTETFKLNYVKTAEVLSLVNAGFAQGSGAAPAAGAATAAAAGATASSSAKGMLSSRGSISAHDTSNQIFVRDTSAVVEAIREVIRNIDQQPKQVMIEARIVEAVTGFNDSFGIRLRAFDANASGDGGQKVPFLANSSRFALGTASGLTNVNLFGTTAAPSLTRTSNQGVGTGLTLTGASTLNLMLFNSAATRLITMELAAAESDNKTKTISAPRVLTMNRKAATINNTQSVNILSGINATTGLPTYITVAAPITLGVTPAINPDNRITLDLNIAKSSITNATTGALSTNTLTTSVIIENGGTLVIGGLATESDTQNQERVPFFGDLPYVGFLFKATTRVRARTELLVFITPRLVSDALAQR